MESLHIEKLGLSTSRVGLGCAGIGGRLSGPQSQAVLESAASAGVRHFDLARSYGYGNAEAEVGRFLRGHGRQNFTITTKAGIAPPARVGRLPVARASARWIADLHPKLRNSISAAANRRVSSGNFSVTSLEASLKTSLQQLQTEYVDILLLHEPKVSDLSDEVMSWLNNRVAAGDARSWGVACTQLTAVSLERHGGINVLQSPSTIAEVVGNDNFGGSPVLRIRHSFMRPDLKVLHVALSQDEFRRKWERRLGQSLSASMSAALLLQLALKVRHDDIVLVGTQSPQHAAALGNSAGVEEQQKDVLIELLADASPAASTHL